jgi:hypothetical protein
MGPNRKGIAFLSYFDAQTGKVVIASDDAPARFQYFQDHFPGKIDFIQAGLQLQTRKVDTAPHWGGAELDSGLNEPRCTSGFAVRRGSEKTMLTAKHCYPLFDAVFGGSPSLLSFGNVEYLGSQTDTELIGGLTYAGDIYVGTLSGTGHPVTGASDPVSWNTYCVSGMVTAESCGHTYTGVTGVVCMPAQYGGYCYTGLSMFTGGTVTKPGDSGAPWYFYDPRGHIYVAGVHTATPWSYIVLDLGVSIITG